MQSQSQPNQPLPQQQPEHTQSQLPQLLSVAPFISSAQPTTTLIRAQNLVSRKSEKGCQLVVSGPE